MTTPLELWRLGTSASPNMDNVRDDDVSKFTMGGVIWVNGESGGISTYTTRQSNDKRWWSLPAGSPIPAGLDLYDDRANIPGHFQWEPKTTMKLADYQAALRGVGPWTKVVKLSEEPGGRIFTPARRAVFAEGAAVPEGGEGMGWEAKSHRYILAAVDARVRELRERLARYPDGSASDEDVDAANELLLYEAISAGITRRGPLRPMLPAPKP